MSFVTTQPEMLIASANRYWFGDVRRKRCPGCHGRWGGVRRGRGIGFYRNTIRYTRSPVAGGQRSRPGAGWTAHRRDCGQCRFVCGSRDRQHDRS